MRKFVSLMAILSITFFAGGAIAANVNQIAYGSLTGTALITFEDLAQIGAPGTNYDAIFESGGTDFAERFVGQALSYSGVFDVLSGLPSGPLSLQVGLPNQNINIFAGSYGGVYGNVLTGLGEVGWSDFDAIGEGSFAVLFDYDQSEFGFKLVGGNGGDAFVSFFKHDGSLIDSITVTGLADTYYGFQRNGGIKDIAGISIYNNDPAGIAFDDLKSDVAGVPGHPTNNVPEPATMLLLGLGLMGLAGVRRKLS